MQLEMMSLNKIKLGKNSRLNVKKSELETLMQSMKSLGLLEPIGVTKNGKGYEVCYGNRRFLAASKLGWAKIPVILNTDTNQSDKDMKNLAENLQRRNIGISEAGRYFKMLLKQSLSINEIAVKLGVTVNYIKISMKTFESVPAKYRDKIVQVTPGKKVPPGGIPFSTSTKILSAQRMYELNAVQTKKLFESASSDENFSHHSVNEYAGKIRSGVKNFVKKSIRYKNVKLNLHITEKEFDSLYLKHVQGGPFNSVSGLMMAILEGKKAIQLRTMKMF